MLEKLAKYLKTKSKSFKVFDWILIAFGLIAVLVFAILFFRKSTYITATVSVGEDSTYYGSWYINTGPKSWFANAFHKGQKEVGGLGKIQAEVLNVYSYQKTATNHAVYIELKLNTVYNRTSNTYTYKGAPVLVGSMIKLNLDNVYAQGLVTQVQGFPNNFTNEKIKLEAQLREENETFLQSAGTKDYLADAIQKGDVVKDNGGSEIIKVLNKRVAPAIITVTTSDGRVVQSTDPTRKDVFFTLEVSTQKINDKYYFLNDIPILIDQQIPINTTTVSIFPVVTKFLPY